MNISFDDDAVVSMGPQLDKIPSGASSYPYNEVVHNPSFFNNETKSQLKGSLVGCFSPVSTDSYTETIPALELVNDDNASTHSHSRHSSNLSPTSRDVNRRDGTITIY